VGYGTNFLAVQMLFKPREPFRSIPLRWIWKQDLVPAKHAEMAKLIGEQVSTRLLTPERAAREMGTVFGDFLVDDAAVGDAADSLREVLRTALPPVVDKALPSLFERLEKP